MDWENERYIRVYTRDSVTWSLWSWQAQAVFMALLRKVSRSGILDLAGHSADKAIAAVLRWPLDVVKAAMPDLLDSGAVVEYRTALVIANFIEAQEAQQSEAFRKREKRARLKDERDAVSAGIVSELTSVSESDLHRPVSTKTVAPSLAELSLAEPSLNYPGAPDGVSEDGEQIRLEEKLRPKLPKDQQTLPLLPDDCLWESESGRDDRHTQSVVGATRHGVMTANTQDVTGVNQQGVKLASGQGEAAAEEPGTRAERRARKRVALDISDDERAAVQRVLDHLSELVRRYSPNSRGFTVNKTNASDIVARYREGVTVEEMCEVLDARVWQIERHTDEDKRHGEYSKLNANTPFRTTNWEWSLGLVRSMGMRHGGTNGHGRKVKFHPNGTPYIFVNGSQHERFDRELRLPGEQDYDNTRPYQQGHDG